MMTAASNSEAGPASASWLSTMFSQGCVIPILIVNCGCLAVLSLSVMYVMLQLAGINEQLQDHQDHLDQLQEQVNQKQQGQIAELSQQVQQEHSLTIIQMAGTFALLTCLITMFHMTTHLRQYKEPVVQRKVLVILWMCPIYAVTSCLSLVFPSVDEYFSVIKDFYEAYVIYNFLSFLIAVLGRGEREVAVEVLAKHADHLKPPTPYLRRYYEPPPESSPAAKANAVLTECQILCLQFVMIRPITALLRFMFDLILPSNSGGNFQWMNFLLSPSFMLSMVVNVSVFFAFSGLLKFYHAVQDDLKWLQPFSKFMSIKGVVFLTFWQGLLISILVHIQSEQATTVTTTAMVPTGGEDGDSGFNLANATTVPLITSSSTTDPMDPQERSAQIQNVLICLEMLLFSIAHWCVFPVEEWQEGYAVQTMAKPGFGIRDFMSDMSGIMSQRKQRRQRRRMERVNMTDPDGQVSSLSLQEEDSQAVELASTSKMSDDESALRRRGGMDDNDHELL